MLRYVYGQDEIIARFVAEMIPHTRVRGFGKCKAIGVLDENGRLIAGLVYHNWNPEVAIIELSCAALPKSRWMTRETIARMYQYPFAQCGSQMVLHCVRADNEAPLRILAALGCMFVKVPRLYGREHDGVLCLLTREAWDESKFNPERIVEPVREAA